MTKTVLTCDVFKFSGMCVVNRNCNGYHPPTLMFVDTLPCNVDMVFLANVVLADKIAQSCCRPRDFIIKWS